MNDPAKNERRFEAASRKVGAYLCVGCSSVVGFVAAWIIMDVAVDFCFRGGKAPPFWTFFVALFVAVGAGFLVGRRSWRRIKRDRGFSLPQFTLRGLFAVITASAVLMGVLQWFEAAPGQWGAVIVFFGIVWVAQRLLFRGRRPWLACVLVGAALGLFLWFLAWTEARSFAVVVGTQVPAKEVIRDLCVAILLCGAMGLIANLFLELFVGLIELVGSLISAPSRAEHTTISGGAPGGRGEPPSRGSEGAQPRMAPVESSRWAKRRPVVAAVAAVLFFFVATTLGKPIRIWYYRHVAEYCQHRNWELEGPTPLEALLLSWSEGSYEYGQGTHQFAAIYVTCRDELTKLGYLMHRVFVFEHIQTGTQDAKDSNVFRLAMKRFPDNIHTLGSWSDKPEPFRLEVWDRPSRISEWEAFVREVDRPDFPKNVEP